MSDHNPQKCYISVYAVGTMHYIGTESHPAIYDPETHTIWYWPNVIQEPREASEFACKALKDAWTDFEASEKGTIEEFRQCVARFNIYPFYVLRAL